MNNPKNSNICIFCSAEAHDRKIAELNSVFAIRDKFPVTLFHTLVIPFRHVSDWFDLTEGEREDSEKLLHQLREDILAADPSVTGFNIGVNCGVSAGQTVMHVHIHLVPRRDGDVDNPTGGVRGVIPERRIY